MRNALRAVLIVAVLALGTFLLLGYRPAQRTAVGSSSPAGTSGTIDIQRARERGAALGEKAAMATAKVEDAVTDSAITAKIKSKMALDDFVKARAIDVTTSGATVTLGGTVRSEAEHDRAMALARETNGITQVIDELRVER